MTEETQSNMGPAQDARVGNLASLVALVDEGPDGCRNAYKWLSVALDFGHQAAQDEIEDLYEWSQLRYDDDQYERAAAHWEIALVYLEGAQGLPRDMSLARSHLREAFSRHRTLAEICEGMAWHSYEIEPVLERLDEEARRVLKQALVGE